MTIVVGVSHNSEPVKPTDNLLFLRNRNLCFKFLSLQNILFYIVIIFPVLILFLIFSIS